MADETNAIVLSGDEDIVEVNRNNRKNSRATTNTTTENRKPPQKKAAIDNKKLATKKMEQSNDKDFSHNPLSMKHHCNPSAYLSAPEGVADANFAASLAKTDEQTMAARQSQQDNDEAYARALQDKYRSGGGGASLKGEGVAEAARQSQQDNDAALALALQEQYRNEKYRNEKRVESKGGSGASLKGEPLKMVYQLAAEVESKGGSVNDIIEILSDADDGSTPVPKRAPENDIDISFDAFIDGVQESVCDPDKVYVVLHDIPSKKRSDFSERIVVKYADLQSGGVSKQEIREYLEYMNSQKYIDGKKFIAWVDLKKGLLKNYEERCDQFSSNTTLMCRIHFFFDSLKFTLKDVIVSEQLYMFWNAVNHPCRFPLVPFLATILGAEIDDNQTVEDKMSDQINLLVRQLSLGIQDDGQGNKSYVNMNYQLFLDKNIHESIPGQIFQVFSNLRENNHGDEMVNDFKELVNAIAILLEIDQNKEEERKYFVKLTELMKWCLEMSEFLGRPLTLERALFHAYAHGLSFNMRITGAQN